MAEGFTELKAIGLRDISRKLKELPDDLSRRAIRKGLRASAQIVVRRAKAAAPRRTGALKRGIVQRAGPRSRNTKNLIRAIVGVEHGKIQRGVARSGKVAIKTRKGGLRFRRATARERRGEDPFYWRFQEFGWQAGNRKNKRRRTVFGQKVSGKRYMRNAFERSVGEQIERFRVVVSADVQKISSRQ